MAQTTGTTTITRKPQDGKSPVAYEIVPDRTLYTSGETAVLPFKVYKIVGEERTLLHEEIERGIYTLVSLSSGDVAYDKDTDNYILNEQYEFAYGDNCTVKLYNSEHTEIATFTWGFTKEGADGKQGTTFSIRKWEDVRIGDRFRVESAEDGVLISDIVIYKDTETGVTSKWICKKAFTVTETTRDDTHISLADANPTKTGSAYWKPFNNFHNVATDLVLADKAIIDNLLLNNMKAYPKDEDGNWDTENPTVEIDGNSGVITLTGNINVRALGYKRGDYFLNKDGYYEIPADSAFYHLRDNDHEFFLPYLSQDVDYREITLAGGLDEGEMKIEKYVLNFMLNESSLSPKGFYLRVLRKRMSDMTFGYVPISTICMSSMSVLTLIWCDYLASGWKEWFIKSATGCIAVGRDLWGKSISTGGFLVYD